MTRNPQITFWWFILLLCICLGCATDDPIPIPDTPNLSFGDPDGPQDYVLFTRSGSSPNGFVAGFDEFPTGDIDVPNHPTSQAFPAISGGTSFRNYVVNQQKLFSGPGYERLILDEDFVPQPSGVIETFGGGSSVVFLNEQKGYYVDFNSRNIQIFDPVSFTKTGEIDMSPAFANPNNGANYYNDLLIRGNRLYACLYTGRTFPPFFYENPQGSVLAVIDTDTDTFLYDRFAGGTKYAGQPFLRFASTAEAEDGTLYVPTQGGLGLDAATDNTPAAILRIPPGMDDFDPDYRFIPQLSIDGAARSTVVNSGFLYVGGGIAYTNVLMEEPATGADLVNRPLMRWARLDLVAQTAELVAGVPANVGLTAGMAYRYDDRILLTVYNPDENISALYEANPQNNTAERVLNVTAGGIIYGFYEVNER